MRTLTADETFLYALRSYGVALRVQVEDGDGVMRDLTDLAGRDWLVSVEWGEDVDNNVADATVSIRRAINDASMAVQFRTSRFNYNAAGAYDPLLAPGRDITIQTQTIAESTDAGATWTTVFSGVIDQISWGTDPIQVTARDQGQVLQDTWIETEADYNLAGAVLLETTLQAILDDTLGAAVVTLYTPVSPAWAITEFATSKQSLMDQLTLLVDQIGWRIAYKWDSGTSTFRLTLYEIDRSKVVPDDVFTADQVLDVKQATLALDGIRNAVTVGYPSSTALDSDGTPTSVFATVTSAPSITAYGRRWIGITEDASSNIDTNAEATALANAVLSDLKDPGLDCTVTVPYRHYVELGDIYTLPADGVHWSTDLDMSVVAFRHRLSGDAVETSLSLRYASPVSRIGSWLAAGSGPGVAPLQDELGPVAGAVSVVSHMGGLFAVVGGSRSRPREYEYHMGGSGFAIDTSYPSTTLVAVTRSNSLHIPADEAFNPIGEARDLIVVPVDERRRRGSATAAVSGTSARLGSQFLDSSGRWGGNLGGTFAMQSRGSSYPPDFWSMSTGTWATDAALDTGATYAAPKTGAKGLLLKSTATATAMDSDKQPVTPGRRYRFEAEWKADSAAAGRTVTVEVRWLTAAEALVSTETVISKIAAAANTWERIEHQLAPPPTARWAQVRVRKAAQAFQVLFDRTLWEESEQSVVPAHGLAGLSLWEDFPSGSQGAGTHGWANAAIAGGPITVGGVAPAALGASWAAFGVVRLSVAGAAGVKRGGSYGLGTAALPAAAGPPPYGTEFRFKSRFPGSITDMEAWAGIWAIETSWPDTPLANACSGIGVRCATVGAVNANWFGVVRNGAVESTVDLGVLGDGTWRDVGWRYSSFGVQFLVDGEDKGAVVTTNLPAAGAPMIPLFGIVAEDGADRDLDCDSYGLFGAFLRR